MSQEPAPPPATPLPPVEQPHSSDSPSKEALLGFLDSELSLLSQQQTNSGWTSWTLAGAVGALTWMLLGQWETGWPAGKTWALAYLAVAIAFSYATLVAQMMQARLSAPAGKTRFFLGSDPKLPKTAVAFFIVQDVGFLWLLFWTPTSSATRFWVGLWLGIALLIWLAVFVISYTQFPIQADANVEGSVRRWIFAIHLCISLPLLMTISLLGLDFLASSPTALDLKVGGLLAALHILVARALNEGGRQPLIDHLLRIRRRLALGDIPTQAAARQVEVEFLGMRVSDVFQEDAQSFLARADELATRCRLSAGSINILLAASENDSTLTPQQKLEIITPVLQGGSRQAQGLHKALNQLLADYKKIESRSRSFLASADARLAMLGILNELHARHGEAHARYVELHASLTRLGLLAGALTGNPNS